jgi:predicted component of type VI protein secretion system
VPYDDWRVREVPKTFSFVAEFRELERALLWKDVFPLKSFKERTISMIVEKAEQRYIT